MMWTLPVNGHSAWHAHQSTVATEAHRRDDAHVQQHACACACSCFYGGGGSDATNKTKKYVTVKIMNLRCSEGKKGKMGRVKMFLHPSLCVTLEREVSTTRSLSQLQPLLIIGRSVPAPRSMCRRFTSGGNWQKTKLPDSAANAWASSCALHN